MQAAPQCKSSEAVSTEVLRVTVSRSTAVYMQPCFAENQSWKPFSIFKPRVLGRLLRAVSPGLEYAVHEDNCSRMQSILLGDTLCADPQRFKYHTVPWHFHEEEKIEFSKQGLVCGKRC